MIYLLVYIYSFQTNLSSNAVVVNIFIIFRIIFHFFFFVDDIIISDPCRCSFGVIISDRDCIITSSSSINGQQQQQQIN